MNSTVTFLGGHLVLILWGLPAAFLPGIRGLSYSSRVSVSFGTGAVLVTILGTVLSIFDVRWTATTLWVPLFVFSAISALFLMRWLEVPRVEPTSSLHRSARALVIFAGTVATLHLVAMLATTRATSMDFLFFWGVKAAKFKLFGGIDADLLSWGFFAHAAPDYPPLVPTIQAISAWFSGEIPWVTAPIATALWFVAALPLVNELIRRRLGESGILIAAFWMIALSISLGSSYSGGNAEGPLVFFETVAALALLTEKRDDPIVQRIFPGLMLAGAVLTKAEGLVGATLLIAGAAARDLLLRRSFTLQRSLILAILPAGALLTWLGFQYSHQLPIGYRGHGPLFRLYGDHLFSIFESFFRYLNAGSSGLSWIIATVLLVISLRRVSARELVSALLFVVGLLGFFFFDYLHDLADPAERISWTLPRISQPALSVLILSSGIASFWRE